MENDIPSDGQAVGGDCFYKVCPKSFGQIFQHRTAGQKALRAADCDSPEARASADGEHYIPAIFFISFSLFNASMGVSESMSSPLIWSRI